MPGLVHLVVAAATVALSVAQLPVPSRELGFVYNNGLAGAQVKVVAYIDLTCPYSKLAFPTLVQVTNHYQPNQVQLRVHLFSLPYHRNSHTISKAAYVLDAYKSPKGATVYDWIQAAYDNIGSLTTTATLYKNDIDVLNFLASLAYNVSGISNADFKAGVSNSDIDQAARVDWKYGCTRGVSGTPSFSVNDVFVDADSSWTVSQWTSLLDSVIGNRKKRRIYRN